MHKVGVTELKAKLSAYLERVKRGGSLTVMERGRPVAWLVPPPGTDPALERHLAEMIRTGAMKPGRPGGVRPSLLRARPVKPKRGASIVETLLEMRREEEDRLLR